MFIGLLLPWKPNAKLISVMTESKDRSNKWQCFSEYYIVLTFGKEKRKKKKKRYHQTSANLSFQNASASWHIYSMKS
jgi:hypothetical protein